MIKWKLLFLLIFICSLFFAQNDNKIRQNDDWSKPINIGKPVNSELNEFYPSLSENNNLYFTLEDLNGIGKDDIYFAKWTDGKYLKPVLFDTAINSSGYEFNAFISKKKIL